MREMRLLGLSEDRRQLLLTGPETGTVALPVDERLRAAILGDTDRLDRPQGNPTSALSPREIQARLRAGASAEDVAAAAGVGVDRVRRFEGPIRDERQHMVDAARDTVPRDGNGRAPLGETVDGYLAEVGVDPASVTWDSWRREDGSWLVQVRFEEHGRARTAHWVWDPLRRQVTVGDGDAAELLAVSDADDLLGLAAAVTDEHPSRSPAEIRPGGLTLVHDAAGTEPGPSVEPPVALPVDPEPGRQQEHEAPPQPVARGADRRSGSTDRQAEADGVAPGRRATVPTWDEILFGARPPEG